jgi:molybdenum-dependent DNA-binding transcriptional regulator ModE
MAQNPEMYPQGLKKNPIKILSPDGKTVKQLNSYREALDHIDNMKQLLGKEYRNAEGGGSAYADAEAQAKREGFKPANNMAMGSYASKMNALHEAMNQRNEEFMAKTAAKKPAYNGQSTMSKLMEVKNPKRK